MYKDYHSVGLFANTSNIKYWKLFGRLISDREVP